MRRAAPILLVAVAACAATSSDDSGDDVVGGDEAAVQSAPVDTHFSIATTALTGPMAKAQRATGALLVPRRSPNGDDSIVTAPDGTKIRSTCGVTFIDRTHAITAAHCTDPIDIPNPPVRPMVVEFYDVAPNLNWKAAARVTGLYPNYVHPALKGQPGYKVSSVTCVTQSRCTFGTWNCPEPALSDEADIALLKCDPLPADRDPVPVAATDDERSAASVFWFHEIYDAPTAQPQRSQRAQYDLFVHYTRADPTGANNLHYFDDGRNDLLPLISTSWRNGAAQRRRLYSENTVVWTDLFGCHGMSGSGVMAINPTTNEFALLGPVATASRDWGSERLCSNLASHREGRAASSYTMLKYTRALAALIRD